MNIPLSLRAKTLIPGYKQRSQAGFQLMLRHISDLIDNGMVLGEEDGLPWIEVPAGESRFFGFWSTDKEDQQLYAMGGRLPGDIPAHYFRLTKDYVTRYQYPHLRPDLHPKGISPENWNGFHGQHKQPLSSYTGIPEHLLLREFEPKQGQVVIEGGSFVGMGAIQMARCVGPEGVVVAIEADSECHALLAKNVAVNEVGNVLAMHRGVWNENTVLELESGPAQANSLVEEVCQGERKVEVETVTVDTMVRQQELSRVDMIGLTINGAELEGIEGAARTISEMRPRLRVAGWYERDSQPIWMKAAEILREWDYAVAISPRGDVLAIPSERANTE